MHPVLKTIALIFLVVGIGALITTLIHFIKINKDKNHENKNKF